VFSVLIITLLLTSKLQRLISDPILQLLQATKTIKQNKDYSIRVTRNDYLEIQELCDGFNSMLEEIQRRDEHMQHLALYDELTGIPNRSLFVDHFNTAIAHSQRTNTQLAICFLDIDNFKPINDGFGHEVGDKLLIKVAKRISSSIRKEDTVSRQGGDEFAILLGGIRSLSEFEQSIDRVYHSITQPYVIDGVRHKMTMSIGVTLYPSDDGDIDTLIRHADKAMYEAKLAGKHRYQLFNAQDDQKIMQKHHRLDEIEQALTNKQFCLFYQPKVNMATGKVFGAEALIRWIHPEKGLIPPLDFLPMIAGS
jgi:diguanylate cyclase (GGDEF)-like protein